MFSSPLLVLETVFAQLADADWRRGSLVCQLWCAASHASREQRLLLRVVSLNSQIGRAALRSLACVSAAFKSSIAYLLCQLHECPRCRSSQTHVLVRQTPGGDEPTEFRVSCLACSHAWHML